LYHGFNLKSFPRQFTFTFCDEKPGVQLFSSKARWITVDTATGSYFYQLYEKSRLVLTNAQVIPHKFVPAEPAAVAGSKMLIPGGRCKMLIAPYENGKVYDSRPEFEKSNYKKCM
jgi:hypothetical protein